MKKFLLPLSEYNRIYQVAHGVLRDVADVNKACVFFASFGAYVLNKHYNIPARPVAGSFALCVDEGPGGPNIACFGTLSDNAITSDANGFHMWVLTRSHIIDFMAPVYREAFAEHSGTGAIPRKMMQKRIEDEAQTPDGLNHHGALFTNPNPSLTDALLDRFLHRDEVSDLIQIADVWYAKGRGKLKPAFEMIDDRGLRQPLHLPRDIPTSSW